MFFLNMVNYPVFFLLMSTLTWDTFLAHKILVTAQVLGFGIWIGLWTWACQQGVVHHVQEEHYEGHIQGA